MPIAVTHGAFYLDFPESPAHASSQTEAQPLRRQARSNAKALETLAHAVEYLIDSRMFLIDFPNTRAEEEAVQLLMTLNRQIFEECPKPVVPEAGMRLWMRRLISFPRR